MKSPIPQDLRGKTLSYIVVVCVGILVAAAVMHIGQLWNVVTTIGRKAMPLFVGFAIAFVLLPLVKRIERFFTKLVFRRKPHPKLTRALSVILTYIVMLALLAGFFAILVPQVITSMKTLIPLISRALPRSTEDIRALVESTPLFKTLGVDAAKATEIYEGIVKQVTSSLNNLTTNFSKTFNQVMGIASSVGSGIYSVLFHVLVGLIASIYMLMDRERFSSQAKKMCYAVLNRSACETLIHWTRRAHEIFAGFITGKIVDSLIIGVLCYVCMLIFGIEYPLLISVIVGVTNVIPFFGPYIGAIPSILFLLIVNPLSALWFGIFILILQQIDGNIIGPMILGDHVGLSAFWIMLSITVGGGLFGFMGMLLSVPTFALIYAIVQTIINERLKARGLSEQTESYLEAPEKPPKEQP